MSCHDARELFSALIDEMLTREERADVDGHLATCAECRRELAAMERTVALVRDATPVRAPVGFVDRVVAAARPTPWYTRAARAALVPWPVKLPLGAAAVLLVAGLAVLTFRGSQEQQRAARYEARPAIMADRRVTERPAEPPATAPSGAASSDRAATAPEPDREAAIASRVDQAEKGAKTKADAETETRAARKARDAAPAQELNSTRAPAPMPQSAPRAASEPALARREALGAKVPARADVIARLAAPDRDTAERALAALTARLAGEMTARRVEGDATVLELVIPRDRYGDFTREAARLGVFEVESETPASPDSVRIAVRLGS